MDIEIDSDDQCTPPEIEEAAKLTSLKLLPEKFRRRLCWLWVYLVDVHSNSDIGYDLISSTDTRFHGRSRIFGLCKADI
ncbi:hypothetical protein JTB14_015635 [Gonioctena quinquepunctata]|nr:hypothetical protein JTB14_015635 [Gonioctena quinquepunctata]